MSVEVDTDMVLSLYYKTTGDVRAQLTIEWANVAPPKPKNVIRELSLPRDWTQKVIPFRTPKKSASLWLHFDVTGTGKIWLDELWLGKGSQLPKSEVMLWTQPEKELSDELRTWAAQTF